MAAETNVGAVKIFGYLEKKGKMKVVTTWKKYWFVLEGRLLLYYRSQEEYENLSPCKGSINMGLATNIKPGLATAGVLEIVSRTNTITLRAKDRCIQEKWLQALLDASNQQTATNPIKMSHFRYSMDDLMPVATKAKHQHQQQQKVAKSSLQRQNTLPYRLNVTQTTGNQSIVDRLRLIGGKTYGGSLDSIIKKTQHKEMCAATSDPNDKTHDDVFVKNNDLYQQLSDVLIENTEYITNDLDHNKNTLLIENDDYIKGPEDVPEYYCTYEEIKIYDEPSLPPRRSESDDSSSVGETKKLSKFSKLRRRFKNFKSNNTNNNNDNSFKKQSTNLIMKVIGKKKSEEETVTTEPIYDTVNYLEIQKQELKLVEEEEGLAKENIVKTLLDLKQTLEEKKIQVKDIMQSTKIEPETTAQDATEQDPPGLPPRSGSRSRSKSPYHDVPKNNSPVSVLPPNYSIDKILNDLELESIKTEQTEELNVRQLIDKFNRQPTIDQQTCDVLLRQKNDEFLTDNDEFVVANIVNRYSDDLNKLLEELTKVTSAPLLTPGVTSSLVQMKSPPITDEEWLAITPIRSRRHSEPDYDVPRPHRSLQILPQSPDDNTDEVIPATRFFGPVLAPLNADKHLFDSSWRSMTPDSLEPLQLLQAAIKKQQQLEMRQQNADAAEQRKVNLDVELKSSVFMDSLEPLNEGATAF